MKLSLQHILAISVLTLLSIESLYAASDEPSTTTQTQYDYQLSPTLVIDLSELSSDKLFSKQPFRTALLKNQRHHEERLFHHGGTPRFTMELINLDLLRLRGSDQLIRYIRSDSGEHAISIIDQNGANNTTSVIVHNDFVGIGINDSSHHFIFGKERSDGEVTYSARWGSRF